MWNPFRIFSEHDHHWRELDKALTGAFEKIKSEKRLTFSWLNYFRKKEQENEKIHQQIQHELGKHDAEIEALKNEIRGLKDTENRPILAQVRTKSGPESEPVSGPKNRSAFSKSFESKIVSMIRPQRKEYIMQKILDFVEKGGYTTKQIETVIVKEKELCGRTAFYDYLKELKYQNLVKISQKNGRKVLKPKDF